MNLDDEYLERVFRSHLVPRDLLDWCDALIKDDYAWLEAVDPAILFAMAGQEWCELYQAVLALTVYRPEDWE